VREQFTWGYWFLAALPPTLVVIVIILGSSIILFRPESQPKISYTMVQTQLEILGPLSSKEWISLAVLCFTVGGWLTTAHHGIDSAWIAIIAFSVLVNTGILDWSMMRKGIDWELLIHMGVTLSIPTLLKAAKIDQWLVDVISPLILPFMDTPAWFFIIIALLTYALKLVFTSFLAVVTLCVALLPLSIDVGMNPWIIAMIILIASEVWFFPYQVDWHMLAYSTTDGKGFFLPAHVPGKSHLCRSLHRRARCRDSILALSRFDELTTVHCVLGDLVRISLSTLVIIVTAVADRSNPVVRAIFSGKIHWARRNSSASRSSTPPRRQF
jgi:DASS family divalent anion:Na+ symporter